MTHPEELLAGYVDGTLPDRERAVVDAHLPACLTCREEIELARAALTALATLEEAPVPLGVTGPAIAEAERERGHRARGWQRLQWAAGLAAAAAVVAVVALNLGGGEGAQRASDGPDAAPGQEAPESAAAFAAVDLEVQAGVNYTTEGLESLARETAETARASDQDEGPVEDGGETDTTLTTGAEATNGGGDEGFQRVAADEALRCLRRAEAPLDEPRDVLVRLIEAEYEGTPAYLAAFLQSPAAGEPPTTVVIYVVAATDCRFLSGSALPF